MRNAATLLACSAFALLTFPLAAQDHPDLSGTWQYDGSASQVHAANSAGDTWVISETYNSIQITETESAGKKVELKCTTDGKECKLSGEKATASFWYNGPMLIEMENKGDHVTRYRMKISPDGKTLTVDTTFILPQSAKDDVLVFKKQA